jgi:tRNA(Arg) A34 adenosine deaminase TadA
MIGKSRAQCVCVCVREREREAGSSISKSSFNPRINNITQRRFGGNGSVLSIHEDKSSDHTYEVTAGLMRDEAIGLFRQFYSGENERGKISL